MKVFDESVKSKALVSLVFFYFLLVLTQGSYFFERSFSSRNRSKKAVIEEEEEEKLLKINKQIKVLLSEKESKILKYLDTEIHEHNLSITITPCSSTIKYSLAYRSFEDLKKRSSISLENVEREDTYEINSMKTIIVEKAKKGWYFVVIHPLSSDSMLTIFVSMDSEGPHELTIAHKSNIRLIPLRKQRLKIMWNQSLVNPQNMSYCVVINTKKEYSALCEAEKEGPILQETKIPIIINSKNVKEEIKKGKFIKTQKAMKSNNDTVIVCVNRRLQLTLTKMKKGVKYYFNLFAINNKTNLTVPYGNSFIKYQFNIKSLILKDGVRKIVDLRMMEGRVSFRYKASNSTKELHFYVLACGGAVDVEFETKGLIKRRGRKAKESANSIPKQTRVLGYRNFKILYPAQGEQYYLKVNAPNVDELTRIKYVEVFATAYPSQRYPMPVLPKDPNLYEFKSQKTCNSVTIGWIPIFDTSINTYCVAVWENRKYNYADLFRGNFQCNLDEKRKKKSFLSSPNESSVSSECEDMITTKQISVTNHTIRGLKPGTSYTIQVTVKKKNGRTLSYKFLKVYTKHSCGY